MLQNHVDLQAGKHAVSTHATGAAEIIRDIMMYSVPAPGFLTCW
jgi:hypothetical protein